VGQRASDSGATGPTGATGATGPTGQAAVYNAGGTLQTNAHIVEGTAATNGSGNGSVSFTSPATFSSSTSYVCTLTPEAGGNPATDGTIVTGKTTTGFSFKSTLNSTTFAYICVGN
jgi:hypothetical protein